MILLLHNFASLLITGLWHSLQLCTRQTHLRFVDHEMAQIPFVKQQAETMNYVFDMWVSKDSDDNMILQYGQAADCTYLIR